MSTTDRKQNVLLDILTSLQSFLNGMRVTATNLVAREKITLQYPYEKPQVSPRYRGLFYLPFNEKEQRLNCTGCTLCEQACPTKVISMTKLGAGKHGGVSEFNMDLGRCMFCNLCVEACPFDAIYMGSAYELASYDRDASVFRIEDLAQGGKRSVEINIKTISEALAQEERAKAAKAKAAAEAKAASEANTASEAKAASGEQSVTEKPASPEPASGASSESPA
jgi:NADH-quinone oxidoreductase subunit I